MYYSLKFKKISRVCRAIQVLDNRNGLRIRGGGTFVGPVGRWGCRPRSTIAASYQCRNHHRGKTTPALHPRHSKVHRQITTTKNTPGVCFHPLNPTGKSYLLPRIIAYSAYCPALPQQPASPISHQALTPTANGRLFPSLSAGTTSSA